MTGATISFALDGLRADDIRSLRATVSRVMRNREIRQRYEELLPLVGQWQAVFELAERYGLSDRQVKHILYGRR